MVRVVKLIIKLFLIFLTLCLTLVTIISGISIGLIFSSPDNISLDLSNSQCNINGTQVDINVPYTINNLGFYGINDVSLYYNISAYNNTNSFQLMDGNLLIGSFPARTNTNTNLTILFNYTEEINVSQWILWNINLHFEMRLSGLYALDLMNFIIGFTMNYTLGGP